MSVVTPSSLISLEMWIQKSDVGSSFFHSDSWLSRIDPSDPSHILMELHSDWDFYLCTIYKHSRVADQFVLCVAISIFRSASKASVCVIASTKTLFPTAKKNCSVPLLCGFVIFLRKNELKSKSISKCKIITATVKIHVRALRWKKCSVRIRARNFLAKMN